jgi:HTH-type transcriptional regulator/antitoxin HigA
MDGNRIVVGLTARGKDADKFWFSLFHELAHIILGHIGQADGTTEEDEKAADSWSRDALISDGAFLEFTQGRNYSAANVCEYAKKLGIAPGILVGRLQNEGCIKYSMLNDLKEHYEMAI